MPFVQASTGVNPATSSASDSLSGVGAGSLVLGCFRYYKQSSGIAPTATIGGSSATLDVSIVDGGSGIGWCVGIFSLVSPGGGSVTVSVDSNDGAVDMMGLVAVEIDTQNTTDVTSSNSKVTTGDSPPDSNVATATASGTAVATWFAANDAMTEGSGFTNRRTVSAGSNELGVSTLASSSGSVEWVSGTTTSFGWAVVLAVYKQVVTSTGAKLTFTHA